MASITYSKLKSGEWGIRGPGLRSGASVTVTKRDGTTKTETVGKVLWEGNGIALATVASNGQSSGSRGGNVCAECGRGGALVSDLEDGLMKHYRCCDIPPDGY